MPRSKLVLFTPGPVRTPPIVAEYMADPPCNYHRQDGFRAMFEATEASVKKLVGMRAPGDYFATMLTSTGTAGNEACLLAFEGLGRGLILRNGFFAARIVDQAVQNRIDHAVLDFPNDRPIDPAAVEAALRADASIKWMYYVSHETRAGLVNPMVELGQVARARGVMVGADIVSSAYAYPIDVEAASLDLAVTSSAKAIQGVPGLAIVFVKLASLPALEKVARRGYYLDVVAETRKQRAEMQPRFAQPVALHAALRAACMHMEEIGIENHMRRIRRQMQELHDHLEPLGAPAQLDPAYRSWIAVNFRLPGGLDYPTFSRRMEEEGYFLLYGIPGDLTHFQLSTIGDLADHHIAGIKQALTKTLRPS